MDVEKGTLTTFTDANAVYSTNSNVKLTLTSSITPEPDNSQTRRNLSRANHIFSTLGYCLGYGNIVFFPALCMKYGGGKS